MDNIKYIVSALQNKKYKNIEIEARLRGDIVNSLSVERLISIDSWEKIQYYERRRISNTHRKCTYRHREIYTPFRESSTICKSSIAKEDLYDMWCTVHVSTEISAPSLIDSLEDVEQVDITRFRKIIANHAVDVTYDELGSSRVEIEVIDSESELNVPAFIHAITLVCSILQDSPIMVARLDWITIKTLSRAAFDKFCVESRSYQKPITMRTSDVMMVLRDKQWLVTPKVDGVRRLLYILNDGIVMSLDLAGCIRYVCVSSIAAELIILDCEYQEQPGIYHVIDIVVHENQYVGNKHFELRQTMISDVVKSLSNDSIRIKPYSAYASFRALDNLYNKWRQHYTIDGLIFVRKNIEYMQRVLKWKPINTVDLEVTYDKDNVLKISTCDSYTVDSSTMLQIEKQLHSGIWEFEFTQSKHLVPLRSRADKPQANSASIVAKNTGPLLPVNIFTGIGCFLMRKYHNAEKRNILNLLHLDKAVVLDIGTGQGGDIDKWKNASDVYCVEPDQGAISEMTGRMKSLRNYKVHIHVFQCTLKELDVSKIHKNISIFAAFFCMNQWEDADWAKLEQLIKLKSTRHCAFVSIALTHPLVGDNRCWTLALNRQQPQKYTISIHNTRITNIQETVISINRLHTIMKQCGLYNTVNKRLSKRDVMTQQENTLSNMYSMLVYKRRPHIPQ